MSDLETLGLYLKTYRDIDRFFTRARKDKSDFLFQDSDFDFSIPIVDVRTILLVFIRIQIRDKHLRDGSLTEAMATLYMTAIDKISHASVINIRDCLRSLEFPFEEEKTRFLTLVEPRLLKILEDKARSYDFDHLNTQLARVLQEYLELQQLLTVLQLYETGKIQDYLPCLKLKSQRAKGFLEQALSVFGASGTSVSSEAKGSLRRSVQRFRRRVRAEVILLQTLRDNTHELYQTLYPADVLPEDEAITVSFARYQGLSLLRQYLERYDCEAILAYKNPVLVGFDDALFVRLREYSHKYLSNIQKTANVTGYEAESYDKLVRELTTRQIECLVIYSESLSVPYSLNIKAPLRPYLISHEKSDLTISPFNLAEEPVMPPATAINAAKRRIQILSMTERLSVYIRQLARRYLKLRAADPIDEQATAAFLSIIFYVTNSIYPFSRAVSARVHLPERERELCEKCLLLKVQADLDANASFDARLIATGESDFPFNLGLDSGPVPIPDLSTILASLIRRCLRTYLQTSKDPLADRLQYLMPYVDLMRHLEQGTSWESEECRQLLKLVQGNAEIASFVSEAMQERFKAWSQISLNEQYLFVFSGQLSALRAALGRLEALITALTARGLLVKDRQLRISNISDLDPADRDEALACLTQELETGVLSDVLQARLGSLLETLQNKKQQVMTEIVAIEVIGKNLRLQLTEAPAETLKGKFKQLSPAQYSELEDYVLRQEGIFDDRLQSDEAAYKKAHRRLDEMISRADSGEQEGCLTISCNGLNVNVWDLQSWFAYHYRQQNDSVKAMACDQQALKNIVQAYKLFLANWHSSVQPEQSLREHLLSLAQQYGVDNLENKLASIEGIIDAIRSQYQFVNRLAYFQAINQVPSPGEQAQFTQFFACAYSQEVCIDYQLQLYVQLKTLRRLLNNMRMIKGLIYSLQKTPDSAMKADASFEAMCDEALKEARDTYSQSQRLPKDVDTLRRYLLEHELFDRRYQNARLRLDMQNETSTIIPDPYTHAMIELRQFLRSLDLQATADAVIEILVIFLKSQNSLNRGPEFNLSQCIQKLLACLQSLSPYYNPDSFTKIQEACTVDPETFLQALPLEIDSLIMPAINQANRRLTIVHRNFFGFDWQGQGSKLFPELVSAMQTDILQLNTLKMQRDGWLANYRHEQDASKLNECKDILENIFLIELTLADLCRAPYFKDQEGLSQLLANINHLRSLQQDMEIKRRRSEQAGAQAEEAVRDFSGLKIVPTPPKACLPPSVFMMPGSFVVSCVPQHQPDSVQLRTMNSPAGDKHPTTSPYDEAAAELGALWKDDTAEPASGSLAAAAAAVGFLGGRSVGAGDDDGDRRAFMEAGGLQPFAKLSSS